MLSRNERLGTIGRLRYHHRSVGHGKHIPFRGDLARVALEMHHDLCPIKELRSLLAPERALALVPAATHGHVDSIALQLIEQATPPARTCLTDE